MRPVRAARSARSNVPNPVMPTFPPLATSRMMLSKTASRASEASLRLPSLTSRAAISSALFTCSLQRTVGVPRPDARPDRVRLQTTVGRRRVEVHHLAPLSRCVAMTLAGRHSEAAWPRPHASQASLGRIRMSPKGIPPQMHQEEASTGIVTGLCEGRELSKRDTSSAWRIVRPMSSSPSRRRHLV